MLLLAIFTQLDLKKHIRKVCSKRDPVANWPSEVSVKEPWDGMNEARWTSRHKTGEEVNEGDIDYQRTGVT